MLQSASGRSTEAIALSSHALFRTADVQEARERVANVFCPHELRLGAHDRRLDAWMCHAPLENISFNRLRYGATVDIDADRLERFLLVMMPLEGVSEVTCGNESLRSTSRSASVVTPSLPLRMKSHADCDQIMVRVDRDFLERQCTQLLGRELRAPIEFRLEMDLTAEASRSWRSLIAHVLTELDARPDSFRFPLVRASLENLVVGTLLTAQEHNYSSDLLRPTAPIAPAFVKRAEAYIDANAHLPLTVTQLANHLGVSCSSLHAGFRQYRQTTPMAHLKAIRLQRVHEDLRSAMGDACVADIGMRWGFHHLGHFSSDYKKKFGETPSATLRRCAAPR